MIFRNLNFFLFLYFVVLFVGLSFWEGSVWAGPAANQVVEILNIPYSEGKKGEHEKHRLDLYLPKGKEKAPVILFVHGGAWFFGDRRMGFDAFYVNVGRFFASQGMITAIISYRLGPHHKHPAQVQDIAASLRFLKENIGKYNGDPQRLFLMGYSAGGHLISLVLLDEQWLKAEECAASDIKGVINISGLYDLRKARGVAQYTFGTQLKEASPIEHAKKISVPFQIFIAEKDPEMLLTSGVEFEFALKKNKTPVFLNRIPARNHFTLMTHLGKKKDLTSKITLNFIAKICLELDIQEMLEKEFK